MGVTATSTTLSPPLSSLYLSFLGCRRRLMLVPSSLGAMRGRTAPDMQSASNTG